MLTDHKDYRFNRWEIAYRIGGKGMFQIVPSPSYGWTADPFLVEYRGEVYLFAEIFLWKSERNGVIGYCKFDGNGFGDWSVTMDRHWHLSYPFVFTKNDKLYMVPESYQLGEVALYELIDFPDKWKKIKTYIHNVEYCDSTFFEYKNGKKYMLTFEGGEKSPHGRSYIFEVTKAGVKNRRYISDRLDGARCGGKVFSENGRMVRVGQNCIGEYGKGLVFYEIDDVEPEYREHEIKRIEAADIKGNFEREHTGIHTYNRLHDIEVIDLKYVCQSEEEKCASDRVRKVFVNKYA